MPSLKEIKVRIASVQSTQKITSAMKMISSAKLHHTQTEAEHALLYADKLTAILNSLLASGEELESPLIEQREVKRVALVVMSSSSGLCGTYNANVWKELQHKIQDYQNGQIELVFYPIGKKIADDLTRAGFTIEERFIHLAEKLSYSDVVALTSELITLFIDGKVDRVELLYHHFKNMAVQELVSKEFLPLRIKEEQSITMTDYIFEPSIEKLQEILFPKLLNFSLYTTLLDTQTAEHAARMMAMQVANDNANDLIQQLTLQYNKNRQQVITNELLDIMGGSMQ